MGSPWGSSGVVGFTRLRTRWRWVHPGSLGSRGCALSVVRFIRGRWVHSVVPWWSLGSSGVIWFTQVTLYWVSLGSSGVPWGSLRSSGIVGFTAVCPGCSGFIRGRWVHLGSLWRSFGSSGVVELTRVRPGGHSVHPGSLGSLGLAQGIVRLIQGCWFSRVCPGCRWVHPEW